MKPKSTSIHSRAILTLLSLCCAVSAANLTWDTVAADSPAITAGSGNWDTSTIIWNNGVTDVAWSQTSATVATNAAIFAGADGSEGAYPVSVTTGIAAQTLTFSNTGYALSAAAARTISVTSTTSPISVATGKTATIGANVTASLSATTFQSNITGGGTLKIAGTGATVTKPSNILNIIGGTTVNVGTSGLLTTSSQLLIGTNAGNGTVIVDGGTASSTTATTNHNLILANASTTNTASGTLTINSGTVIHPAVSGGLRFGSTTAMTAPNTATGTLNLNGGQFTVARLYEGSADPLIISNVNFNGGKLIVRTGATNAANFMTGLDAANVLSGGAVIDTNGVDTTIAQPLLDGGGSGGLTKQGNGILTLTGANTYTGGTVINGGKLNLNAPYSSVTATTINANARLRVTTGATASTLPAITVSANGGFEINTGTYNAGTLACLAATDFDPAGDYVVDLTGSGVAVGDITLLTYTNRIGSGLPSLGSVPPGVTGTIEDTGSAVVLHVLTPQVPEYIWSVGTGDWDTSTANWTGQTYTEGAVATFPEIVGTNTVTLTSARSPFSVGISNNSTSTYTFAGSAISGSAKVTKTGTGVATFDVSNSYTGTTTISSGGLVVKADSALGTAAGGTTITGNGSSLAGAVLGLKNSVAYSTAEPISGSGIANTAALGDFIAAQRGFVQALSGNCTFAGPIQINATGISRLGVQDSSQLTLSGPITMASGVSGVIVLFRAGGSDGDYVTLSNSGNSWDGETRIFTNNTGTGAGLKLGVDNGLPTATSIVAGGGSSGAGNTFDLNGFDQTLNGLTWSNGTLHVRNNAASTTSVLTLNPAANANNYSIAGFTTIDDGAGTVALVKEGLFSQNLEGTHTYSGSTTINGGKLSLGPAATIANTVSLTIAASATFDVLAKTTYAIPSSTPVTLKLDGTDGGSAGKIQATELDITDAAVTLDPVTTLDDPVYILAEYTTLVGTAFASVSPPSGYHLEYAYNGGTQIALVTDTPADPFLDWINATWPSLSDKTPTGDPDGDGIENLLEYILKDGDPSTSGTAILPTLDATGSNFVFTFYRRNASSADTTQTFQYGSDLSGWTPLTIPGGTGVVVTDQGGGIDKVDVTVPKGANVKLFGRLQAVKP